MRGNKAVAGEGIYLEGEAIVAAVVGRRANLLYCKRVLAPRSGKSEMSHCWLIGRGCELQEGKDGLYSLTARFVDGFRF